MQTISDSVGLKGPNKKSDVALVQAILLKTPCLPNGTNSKTPTYLSSYDGDCGIDTQTALRCFQGDYVNITPDGRSCALNPDATDALVKPGDATWKKLLEKVPAAFSDMRILEGAKTVYLAASDQQLNAATASVAGLTFADTFRSKVLACINQLQSKYGIVVTVCPQGDRRTFQAQYELLVSGRNVTHAGPGESNHNFGMAADFGFKHLRWLKQDGTVQEERSWWLESLSQSQGDAEATKFWQVLRAVGTSPEVGAFRGPESDSPHLQNWDDRGVDMASRLADLMTRAGPMKWRGSRQSYSCDFGFGGEYYPVGSSRQIWSNQGNVTIATLNQARAAQARRQPPPRGPFGGAAAAVARPAPQALTQADVITMQRNLRSDFEAADVQWQSWTAH